MQKLPEPIYVVRPTLPDLGEFKKHLESIWESGIVTNFGPKHKEFELAIANYLKVSNASAFVNGHSALESAVRALKLSGEVITTPFTFPSTPHAISLNGIEPVFCDIDPKTFGICPDKIRELVTDKTSAILAVHVYGNPCNVVELQKIADENNLNLIYDAAHAFGVEINGKGIGEFGDLSVFSLHATKVFNAIEGGLVTFANAGYKDKLFELKNFGYQENSQDEDISGIGSNLKMSELHAAVGLLNLNNIDEQIAERRKIYTLYQEHINAIKGLTLIEPYATKPNYAYCPILVDPGDFGMTRDQLYKRLAEYNVFCRKYFNPPCNELSCYKKQKMRQPPTPVASSISSRILCLPIYPGLLLDSVNQICEIIEGLSKEVPIVQI